MNSRKVMYLYALFVGIHSLFKRIVNRIRIYRISSFPILFQRDF